MGLRAEIVDLVRAHLVDELPDGVRVRKVAEMEMEPRAGCVHVAVEVLNAPRIERACPANDAVHGIFLFQQEFGEVGTVLSRNAEDERASLAVHPHTNREAETFPIFPSS